jgi:hypothetical protein
MVEKTIPTKRKIKEIGEIISKAACQIQAGLRAKALLRIFSQTSPPDMPSIPLSYDDIIHDNEEAHPS